MITTLPPSFWSRWSLLGKLSSHVPSALNRFAIVSLIIHAIFFIAFAGMGRDRQKLPPPSLPVFIVADETPVMQQVVSRTKEPAPLFQPVQASPQSRPSPAQPVSAPPTQFLQPQPPAETAKPETGPTQARTDEPVKGGPAEREGRSEKSLGQIRTGMPSHLDEARMSPEVSRRGTDSTTTQGFSMADRAGRGSPDTGGTDLTGRISPGPATRRSAEPDNRGAAGPALPGKRAEFTDSAGGGTGLSGKVSQRVLPSEAPVMGGSIQSASIKRSESTGDRLSPVGEVRRPGLPPQPEPVFSAGKKAFDAGGPRTVEDVRGTWIRLDNAGPVSHLNASCFEIPDMAVIYVDVFRLRCSSNQIVEAWKKR